MALKEEWKDTGKGLGKAFKGLGKNIVRSVKTGVDKIDETDEEKAQNEGKETVFNDGSWRETGKELGHAFKDLGQSILHSAKTGVDYVDESFDDKKDKKD